MAEEKKPAAVVKPVPAVPVAPVPAAPLAPGVMATGVHAMGPKDTVSNIAVLDTPARTSDAPRKPGHEDDEEENKKALPLLKKASPLPKDCKAKVISEHDRAPEGFQRFRIRAMNYQGYTHLYVLAAKGDLKAAKECYIQASGLKKYLDDLAEVVDPREVKRPQLNVLPLPD